MESPARPVPLRRCRCEYRDRLDSGTARGSGGGRRAQAVAAADYRRRTSDGNGTLNMLAKIKAPTVPVVVDTIADMNLTEVAAVVDAVQARIDGLIDDYVERERQRELIQNKSANPASTIRQLLFARAPCRCAAVRLLQEK